MKKRLFKKKTDLKRQTKIETGVFKFTGKLRNITERINKKTEKLVAAIKKDSKQATTN